MTRAISFRHRRALRRSPQRQRGVALFVALISMLLLTVAGLALVRSVDTGGSVAGNIAFRTASVVAANHAIEEAVWEIFKRPVGTRINPINNDLPRHYYATLQPNEQTDGTPEALSGPYPPAKYTMTVWTDPVTNVEVRYVIERVCTAAADGKAPTIATCDLLPPKVSPAGTDNEPKRPPLPSIPHYRVTARVDVPNTNTTTIAQTFLR